MRFAAQWAVAMLIVFVSSISSERVDDTRVPETGGADVIEAVLDQLESSCVFPEDKLFLWRLAQVETVMGAPSETYADPEYHGGIWKVIHNLIILQ